MHDITKSPGKVFFNYFFSFNNDWTEINEQEKKFKEWTTSSKNPLTLSQEQQKGRNFGESPQMRIKTITVEVARALNQISPSNHSAATNNNFPSSTNSNRKRANNGRPSWRKHVESYQNLQQESRRLRLEMEPLIFYFYFLPIEPLIPRRKIDPETISRSRKNPWDLCRAWGETEEREDYYGLPKAWRRRRWSSIAVIDRSSSVASFSFPGSSLGCDFLER